jgi:hypothetical protein
VKPDRSDAPAVPDLRPAYWFSAFNALSFQVVLAGPMVLYAKTLGASATVLGIVAASHAYAGGAPAATAAPHQRP